MQEADGGEGNEIGGPWQKPCRALGCCVITGGGVAGERRGFVPLGAGYAGPGLIAP